MSNPLPKPSFVDLFGSYTVSTTLLEQLSPEDHINLIYTCRYIRDNMYDFNTVILKNPSFSRGVSNAVRAWFLCSDVTNPEQLPFRYPCIEDPTNPIRWPRWSKLTHAKLGRDLDSVDVDGSSIDATTIDFLMQTKNFPNIRILTARICPDLDLEELVHRASIEWHNVEMDVKILRIWNPFVFQTSSSDNEDKLKQLVQQFINLMQYSVLTDVVFCEFCTNICEHALRYCLKCQESHVSRFCPSCLKELRCELCNKYYCSDHTAGNGEVESFNDMIRYHCNTIHCRSQQHSMHPNCELVQLGYPPTRDPGSRNYCEVCGDFICGASDKWPIQVCSICDKQYCGVCHGGGDRFSKMAKCSDCNKPCCKDDKFRESTFKCTQKCTLCDQYICLSCVAEDSQAVYCDNCKRSDTGGWSLY